MSQEPHKRQAVGPVVAVQGTSDLV